jgi:hypothetical protein
MIEVADFSILIMVKSSCFFFLRGYLGLITQVMGPSTFDLFFIRLSTSHDLSCEFSKLTQLTCFFSFLKKYFSSISSFNIVFDWELGFIIYLCLFFIRLSQLHDPIIVLNRLTQVDLTHFLCYFFLIKFLTNFII